MSFLIEQRFSLIFIFFLFCFISFWGLSRDLISSNEIKVGQIMLIKTKYLRVEIANKFDFDIYHLLISWHKKFVKNVVLLCVILSLGCQYQHPLIFILSNFIYWSNLNTMIQVYFRQFCFLVFVLRRIILTGTVRLSIFEFLLFFFCQILRC